MVWTVSTRRAPSLPPLPGGSGAKSVFHEGSAVDEGLSPTLPSLGRDLVPILEVPQRAGGRVALGLRLAWCYRHPFNNRLAGYLLQSLPQPTPSKQPVGTRTAV